MLSKLPAKLYADLVGKPFLAAARGPFAYDCVGLVLELQRGQGRFLRDYTSTPEEFHRQFDGERGIFGPCRAIDAPEAGCIVLLRMLDDQRHVATMLDGYRLLHTSAQLRAATIESLLHTHWHRRALGFYVPEVPA